MIMPILWIYRVNSRPPTPSMSPTFSNTIHLMIPPSVVLRWIPALLKTGRPDAAHMWNIHVATWMGRNPLSHNRFQL
ncbi:hypothetical protein MA16_Dca016107 [Dendrobium catenatum]|uniref:Uncharacterized protein n=1 Tax=Dendrobium catenatum TaxID=906689 RepID=A0A2I0WI32_9ASPA|nr:hypothetical protein MA16_Dca016107 [Dendrobium catenatum]